MDGSESERKSEEDRRRGRKVGEGDGAKTNSSDYINLEP